jgi:putative drug exporter of the RND superfamily
VWEGDEDVRRLTRLVVMRRRAVLVAILIFVIGAGAAGSGVTSQLSVGGYTDPSTESARADAVLASKLHYAQPNLVLLVTDPRGVDDPAVARAGTAISLRLASEASVADAASYWTSGHLPSLRNRAGDKALILVRVRGSDDDVQARLKTLVPRYSGVVEGLHVRLGGSAMANFELTDITQADAARAESVALPITLIALVIVFGSVVAGALPLLVGIIAIEGALVVLRVVAAVTPTSVFALNISTVLGLGLAIDYSLFIITRYREELGNGHDVPSALALTMSTAGRTVLFSAITVALALAALLVTPFPFMRSFAYAGIPTALFAALAALVALPALLALLGPNVDRLRLIRWRSDRPLEAGLWYRLANWVMKRAVAVVALIVLFLIVLGLPFLHVRLSYADERVLPRSSASYQVGAVIRQEFDSKESQAVLVVAPDAGPSQHGAEISGYAARLSRLTGVARVDGSAGTFAQGVQVAPPSPSSSRFQAGSATYLQVVPAVDMTSAAGTELLHRVRSSQAPFATLVTGPQANFEDSLGSLYRSLPIVLAWIALSMAVLLFLMTGSLVVPVKALALGALSLTATFGALVWGFQDGHLRGWVGDFVVTGSVTWTVLLLLFCIAFGLSMDYEVFLISRIKEEYDRTADNVRAVTTGLQRTGRLVTAAAIVISLLFVALVSSGVTYIKVIGLGLALAVVMDATLIRGALVPAFMRLAGRLNWWAPSPLRRLHRWIGVTESGAVPTARPAPASESPSKG